MNSLEELFHYSSCKCDSSYQISFETVKRQFSYQQLIGLCGVPSKSELIINNYGESLVVNIQHPYWKELQRSIFIDDDGRLVLHNSYNTVNESMRGKGLSTYLLYNQIKYGKDCGVSEIRVDAARDDEKGLIGYYVWPVLGFNLTNEYLKDNRLVNKLVEFQAEINAGMDLLDIVLSPEGKEKWRQYGIGLDLNFDLSENSKSLNIFEKYFQNKFGREIDYDIP